MLMTIEENNFADVVSLYGLEEAEAADSARKAMHAIEGNDDAWLQRMLRNHATKGNKVTDPDELDTRFGFDRYLSGLGCLEVGVAAGVIPLPTRNSEFWTRAKTILGNSLVRKYYEEYYPYPLASLLRRRLHGDSETVVFKSASLLALSFMDLDRHFFLRLEEGVLLRFLDDFKIGGYNFESLIELLEHAEEYFKRLSVPPADRDPLDRAAAELGVFFNFCVQLDQLLQEGKDFETIRARIWLKYSYWFDIIGEELKERFGQALKRILAWETKSKESLDEEPVHAFIHHSLEVLERLTQPSSSDLEQKIMALEKNSESSESKLAAFALEIDGTVVYERLERDDADLMVVGVKTSLTGTPGETTFVEMEVLTKLGSEVMLLVAGLPDEKREEIPQIEVTLENLVKQATAPKPNRKRYEACAEGLLVASNHAEEIHGSLAGTIQHIGRSLWPNEVE
jgi:hypothetical protein